jgi:hypothetical protein
MRLSKSLIAYSRAFKPNYASIGNCKTTTVAPVAVTAKNPCATCAIKCVQLDTRSTTTDSAVSAPG